MLGCRVSGASLKTLPSPSPEPKSRNHEVKAGSNARVQGLALSSLSWFLSSPFIIRVPFFLVFGFSKGGPTIKRAKGYHSGT